jgi:hypothetical protein
MVMNMEGKTVYFKETVECQYPIFGPLSKTGPLPYCKTAAKSQGFKKASNIG